MENWIILNHTVQHRQVYLYTQNGHGYRSVVHSFSTYLIFQGAHFVHKVFDLFLIAFHLSVDIILLVCGEIAHAEPFLPRGADLKAMRPSLTKTHAELCYYLPRILLTPF